jgi:Ni,Fe-hydrogenase I cytochrome b subunit
MKSPIAVIVAIATGLVILAGYFIPNPTLEAIRTPMLNWAVVLSGVAGLVAILYLIFGIHWARAKAEGLKQWQSLVVIVAFIITLVAGLFLGPTSPAFQRVATSIQTPIESSLMALLAVTLTISSLKLLQRQRNWMGIVFFFTTILFLILNSGLLSFTDNIPILRNLLSGLQLIPTAGARGILLGVALGSLATGIRILIGADRPYDN